MKSRYQIIMAVIIKRLTRRANEGQIKVGCWFFGSKEMNGTPGKKDIPRPRKERKTSCKEKKGLLGRDLVKKIDDERNRVDEK